MACQYQISHKWTFYGGSIYKIDLILQKGSIPKSGLIWDIGFDFESKKNLFRYMLRQTAVEHVYQLITVNAFGLENYTWGYIILSVSMRLTT